MTANLANKDDITNTGISTRSLIKVNLAGNNAGSKKTAFDLDIVERVKKIRLENKMSQAVLAIKLGVSDAFIGAIENPTNRAKYNLTHLNKLAIIFNCSPRMFLPEKPFASYL